MSRSPLARALHLGALLALPALTAAAASAAPAAATTLAAVQAPFAFTAADLEAYERGIAREAELVQAARARGRAARTPAERSAAAQAEWEAATVPGGAQAAGLPLARYRQVRATLHHVLSTLDFQGKIDGPQEMDVSAASPEMKRRLATDPIAGLAPASAAALRARMDRVVSAYVAYVTLVAVNG
jgi:flagellar hook-length control protein FliK